MGKSADNRPSFPLLRPVSMPAAMASDAPLLFVPVGTNAARPFGIEARDRACRLAANAGLECAVAPEPGRAMLLASMRYAWDPAWLKAMRKRPGTMLTLGGEPVMVHVPLDMLISQQPELVLRIAKSSRAMICCPRRPPSSAMPS